jgi:hypothetical protein
LPGQMQVRAAAAGCYAPPTVYGKCVCGDRLVVVMLCPGTCVCVACISFHQLRHL